MSVLQILTLPLREGGGGGGPRIFMAPSPSPRA